MNNLNNSSLIKIPFYINFFYNKEKNFIILKISKKLKRINLNSLFYLVTFKNKIFLTIDKKKKILKRLSDKFYFYSRLFFFIIKRSLFEIEIKVYKKLKLIGIGYKIFLFENILGSAFVFKLGFSHNIFLKMNTNISSFCLKFTEIFIIGDFSNDINKSCSLIKSFKLINVYISKGILFYNEKINLKKNKKVL